MQMPYTTNPFMPKLRAKAVDMYRQGHSMRDVARHFGVVPSTISKWNKRSPLGGTYSIETRSSRPKYHPKQTPKNIIYRIIQLRKQTKGRCAKVIHKYLDNEGISISLSTVARIIKRYGLTKKRSPYKRYHKNIKRPVTNKSGDLVQIDTIHLMKNKKDKIYIYTLIDVYSRWAFAKAVNKINTKQTVKFVKNAIKISPFKFNMLQTDNGPEFKTHFTERIKIPHRHSRVRKPNDNAHLERFNRTIQEECLAHIPKDVNEVNKRLTNYLKYYNTERLHLGINLKTPIQLT